MAIEPGSSRIPLPMPGRRAGTIVDGDLFVGSAVRFARALRLAGLTTDLGAAIDFARALGVVEIGDREQVRSAGAAVFVRRRDDLEVYDEVFARFWRSRGPRLPTDGGPSPMEPPREVIEDEEEELEAEAGEEPRRAEPSDDGRPNPGEEVGDEL